MKTWIIAHPYWSVLIAVGFITLIVLVVKSLNNASDEAPATPAEPQTDTNQGKRVIVPPMRVNSHTTINVNPASGMGGGMNGARVNQNSVQGR